MAKITSSITLQSPETDDAKVYAVVIKSENIMIMSTPANFDHTISTTVTKHPDVVAQWIHGVYADVGNTSVPRLVGFSVAFDLVTSRIKTAQFCVGNRCLVFHLQAGTSPGPSCLVQFLQDKDKFTFLGTEILHNMNMLRKELSINGLIHMLELGYYSEELTTNKTSLLDSIVEQDWTRAYSLSVLQVHYACLDAFLNIHIAKCLWKID